MRPRPLGPSVVTSTSTRAGNAPGRELAAAADGDLDQALALAHGRGRDRACARVAQHRRGDVRAERHGHRGLEADCLAAARQRVARRVRARGPRARSAHARPAARSSLVPCRDLLRGDDDRDRRAGAGLDLLDPVVHAGGGERAARRSPRARARPRAGGGGRRCSRGRRHAQRERSTGSSATATCPPPGAVERAEPPARLLERTRRDREPAPARGARSHGDRRSAPPRSSTSTRIPPVPGPAADDDLAAAVLDRVREQVPERLRQPARVRVDGARAALPVEGHAPAARAPPRAAMPRRCRSTSGSSASSSTAGAARRPRPRPPRRRRRPASGTARSRAPRRAGAQPAGAERLDPERDRGERPAQLVGGVGDERGAAAELEAAAAAAMHHPRPRPRPCSQRLRQAVADARAGSGRTGAPSRRASCAACTRARRACACSPSTTYPQTSRRSCSFGNTAVGSAASAWSSENSFADRWTRLSVELHAARDRIDHEPAHAHDASARAVGRPAQDRADARMQLGIGERLPDVVVAPAREAAHAVGLAAASAEHDHRQVRVEPRREAVGRAHTVEQLEPVAVAQHQVEQDEVGLAHLDRPQPLAHAARGRRPVAVGAQVVDQELGRGLVVLHHQHRSSPRPRPGKAGAAATSPPDGLQSPLQLYRAGRIPV